MSNSSRSMQSGAALVVSLIMLLIMTLMIVAASRTSILDLLMATNAQNANEALQGAEDSVLHGEQRLVTDPLLSGIPTLDFSADTDDGLCLDSDLTCTVDTVDWAGLNHETDGERNYIIQYIGPATVAGGSLSIGAGAASSVRYLYRVSGQGASSRSSARVVQTIFATME